MVGNRAARRHSLVVTLDIRNAFIPVILRMMHRRRVPKYIADMCTDFMISIAITTGEITEEAVQAFIDDKVLSGIWGRSSQVIRIIYEQAINPMILYGAEIWICRYPNLKAITKA